MKSPTQKFQSSDPPTHKLFPTFAILKRQTITNLLIYGTLLLAQPELRQQSARGRRGQGRVVGVATLFHGPLVSRLSAQDVRSDHHQDQKGEEGGLSVKARISGPHGNRRTNFKTSGIFCRWIFPPTKMWERKDVGFQTETAESQTGARKVRASYNVFLMNVPVHVLGVLYSKYFMYFSVLFCFGVNLHTILGGACGFCRLINFTTVPDRVPL